MATIIRGSGTPVTALYRGATPIREVRRGSTLVWTATPIRDDFDLDGWLRYWINELCTDPGGLIQDVYGRVVDGLGNAVGNLVSFVEGGANQLGTLVSGAATSAIDAYCGMWGGDSPPNGLIGLINGIPIIGGVLADWLQGELDLLDIITNVVGRIPVIGKLGELLGLLPDAAGKVLEPVNLIVDAIGDVVGTITCGRFQPPGGIIENICYVIGVVGHAARMIIPDGLVLLPTQTSRFRHPTQTLGDDGWVEVEVADIGSPGYATDVFRRYSNNGSGDAGVGLRLVDSTVSIVRRVGGNETLVGPGLGRFGPGSRIRLVQTGDTHTLVRDGIELGTWTDTSNTAAKGGDYRSVALQMQGGKDFLGPRRFSPSLSALYAA